MDGPSALVPCAAVPQWAGLAYLLGRLLFHPFPARVGGALPKGMACRTDVGVPLYIIAEILRAEQTAILLRLPRVLQMRRDPFPFELGLVFDGPVLGVRHRHLPAHRVLVPLNQLPEFMGFIGLTRRV